MSALALLLAVIAFVLVGLGHGLFGLSEFHLLAFGLALLALGLLLPGLGATVSVIRSAPRA